MGKVELSEFNRQFNFLPPNVVVILRFDVGGIVTQQAKLVQAIKEIWRQNHFPFQRLNALVKVRACPTAFFAHRL